MLRLSRFKRLIGGLALAGFSLLVIGFSFHSHAETGSATTSESCLVCQTAPQLATDAQAPSLGGAHPFFEEAILPARGLSQASQFLPLPPSRAPPTRR